MDRITLHDLKALWSVTNSPCASIFLPLDVKSRTQDAAQVTLKNLARDAERQLLALGMDAGQAQALLAPVEALVGDRQAWRTRGPGLAVYAAPDWFRALWLVQGPAPRAVVSDRFLIRPLLATLQAGEPFYVLALSQKRVRLLRATALDVEAVPLPAAPRSLADFQRYEESQGDAQYRQGGEGGTYAGGGHQADHKDAQRRYVHAIAKAVATHLGEAAIPLVFAGVEALHAMARESGLLRQLVSPALPGNADRRSDESLRDAALRLLAPLREAEANEAMARFRALAGTGLALTGVAQVLPAARDGRVEGLLLQGDGERWGRIGPDGAGVEAHDAPQTGDAELLDAAGSWTLRGGGRVLTLPAPPATEAGIEDGVAALLRY